MNARPESLVLTEEPPAPSRLRAATGDGWTSGSVFRLLRKSGLDLTLLGLLLYITVIITLRLPGGNIAVVTGVAGLIFSRHKLVVPAYLWWLLAFIIWDTIGVPFSVIPSVSQDHATGLAKIWVISLLAVNALRTPARLAIYATVFLLAFLTHPLRSIFMNFARGIGVNGRYAANGEFANPNQFAVVLLTALALSICLFIWHRRGSPHWLGGVCSALCPVAILLTSSRGVFIGMTVFTLLVVAGSRQKGKAVVALAFILLVGAMVAPPQVWKRLGGLTKATSTKNLKAVDSEGSAVERYEIWQTAFRIIWDHPVAGTGGSTYRYMNGQYSPFLGRRDTHSTYLNILAETGVIGFGFYFAAIGSLMVLCTKALRLPRLSTTTRATLRVLISGLVGFLIAAIWGTYTSFSFLFLYLAVMSAAAAVAVKENAASSAPPAPSSPTRDDNLYTQVAQRLGHDSARPGYR